MHNAEKKERGQGRREDRDQKEKRYVSKNHKKILITKRKALEDKPVGMFKIKIKVCVIPLS